MLTQEQNKGEVLQGSAQDKAKSKTQKGKVNPLEFAAMLQEAAEGSNYTNVGWFNLDAYVPTGS